MATTNSARSLYNTSCAAMYCALVGAMFCGASATAQTKLMTRTVTPAVGNADAKLVLGAGDLIDVQVFSTPELSGRLRIDEKGMISLPVGGDVLVSALTPQQASLAIEAKLRDGQIMPHPHVAVFVNEYATQGVTVIGEVRSPGTYTLLGEHSLYRALAAAGGTSSNAGASITLTHRTDPSTPIVVQVHSPNYSELEQTTEVVPGDIIVVAKADLVYVVGDVGHPGAYYMQNGEPMSVLNAIALASGLGHTAADTKVSIVRPTSGGALTIPLNVKRIMQNKDKNVILQASDVLVIPRSGLKALMETAVPGAATAVTSAVATALVLR